MPKSNGSVVGAGAPVPVPAPAPRMGSNREMTTPLLGPPTPQHQMAPVVPARNSNSPFYPGNLPTPQSPIIPSISLSPFTSKLPSSLQSQLNLDFGFSTQQDQIVYKYDSTGIFHWCPHKDIEQCLVTRKDIARSVYIFQMFCVRDLFQCGS
jgi:hypothetical protein